MAGYAGTDRWIMSGAIILVGGCYLLTAAGISGIGIAVSPEPSSGPSPHLAWVTLGAVTIAFATLLGWLFVETRDGSVLGLAERLTTSVQTCWPAVVAVALYRTRNPELKVLCRDLSRSPPVRRGPAGRSAPGRAPAQLGAAG